MLYGKLKKHSKTIQNWYKKERSLQYPSKKTMSALTFIANHSTVKSHMDYKGDWREHLEYCCDRMHGGRAKAILQLIRKEKKSGK